MINEYFTPKEMKEWESQQLNMSLGKIIRDRAMDFSYPVNLELDQSEYIARAILEFLKKNGYMDE